MKERNKGKMLLCFPENCCVVDVETTGLDTEYSEIIEIGAIRIRDGEPRDRFTSIVKPSEPIDEFIEKLTGITNEMLEKAYPLSRVLPVFRDFLADDIIVGHNVHFDINFLYDGCEDLGLAPISNDFVDTMRIARILLPDLPHHRLRDLCDYYQIINKRAHRAVNDCEATHKILRKLQAAANETSIDLSAHKKRKLHAADITTNNSDFDESHPLYGKQCVFTGAMRIQRKDAMQIVCDLGGKCADTVTKKTDFLIIGDAEYRDCSTGKKTGKMEKAETLILKGADLTILSESAFFDLIK